MFHVQVIGIVLVCKAQPKSTEKWWEFVGRV
jgi:hypothetical protein